MQVNSTSSTYQMQMRKMDGTGNGMRNRGQKNEEMSAIMQSLSSEDRTSIQDQMQSLSQADRSTAMNQIKQLDTSTMSTDAITQSIMDILNPTTSTQETASIFTSLYA